MNTEIYAGYKNLQKCNIQERVKHFQETATELINSGYCILKIQQAIIDFESNEQFEASQGLKNALSNFYFMTTSKEQHSQ